MTDQQTAAPANEKPGGKGAHLKPLLPWVAVVCALLAAWLAWTGWVQFQAEHRESALVAARDAAARKVADSVAKQLAELDARLKSAPVQAALAKNDFATASQTITRGWAGAEHAEILADGFESAYAALPQTGFGRLGLAESAVAENKAVAAIVRDGGSARLGLAAPAHTGAVRVGVAYVRLPLDRAAGAIQASNLDDDSYLALRQGSFSVV